MYLLDAHKTLREKLNENYIRMLWVILNKSWKQHPTEQQLYGHLPPISKTTQVRRIRHAGHCWRGKNEIITNAFLWTFTHGRVSVSRTYLHQLGTDTGSSLEDLPGATDDRVGWAEGVKKIHAVSTTWWWSLLPRILFIHEFLKREFFSFKNVCFQ